MQPQQFITERSKVALGLNPHLRAQMAIYDDNVGLESFMQRASRISQRLTSCYADEATTQLTSLASSPPVPEPMQIDSARLSRTERARRRAAGLCLYCAASDHLIRTCPVRPPCPAVSTIQLKPDVSILSLLPVQLLTSESSVTVSALVNLGSSGNFISKALLTRLNLPRKRQPWELRVETIQGKPLGRGRVNYQSTPSDDENWMSAWGNHLISGTGRAHGGYHSGTPLAHSTFSRSQMGSLWNHSLERYLFPALSVLDSQAAQEILADRGVSTLVESPETQVKLMIPSDYQAFTASAMGLCHRPAAWRKTPQE